ncbi:MAG TPA: tetratricopeptide repeat protein [Candidatus Sulfotelmatobacter sp.]|nr:tetratricopeptide repeat protein [Candidatus Sulfotelmatobacter sp.]
MSKNTFKFPNISRIITENKFFSKAEKSIFRLLNKPKVKKIFYFSSLVLTFLIIGVLVAGISILSLKMYKNLVIINKINQQREKIQSQINFWTSVIQKYPGYKDSYFRIAVLEYSLGDLQKSEEFNKKALLLDPNYEDAKKLELLLNKN